MLMVKRLNKSEIGKALLPKKIFSLNYKQELEILHQKLYFDNLNYSIFASFFGLSIILAILAFFFSYPTIYVWFNDWITANILYRFLVMLVSWLVIHTGVYYLILLSYFVMHDSKFKKIEADIEHDLPDFIDNLVSNLKGGISLEKGLLKSVRPEQKSLLREVTLINEKIMMGLGTLQALKEFRERFESPIISRTFFLVEEGLRGGGNLAAPLERISQNLKKIYALQEEISSNSSGFALVIRAIVMFVAPVLFALAITLLTFIGNLFKLLSDTGDAISFAGELPQEFNDYLVFFSYAMIILITFFSSLITSELKNEKVYDALKYLPIYIVIAIVFYIFISDVLLGFFGSII